MSKLTSKEYHRQYYQQHKEQRKLIDKVYYEQNKNYILNYKKQFYLLNKVKILKLRQEYYKNNKITVINKVSRYTRKKLKMDINFKLKRYLRSRIWHVLKGINKSKRTMKLIGCSIEQLKQHLESKFQTGMSWKNYGKWHVDHIRPCASFDLSKPEEQTTCFNYTNLQPLWAHDNLQKYSKVSFNLSL